MNATTVTGTIYIKAVAIAAQCGCGERNAKIAVMAAKRVGYGSVAGRNVGWEITHGPEGYNLQEVIFRG